MLIDTIDDFELYCWLDSKTRKHLFNIVPTGSSEPTGGFFQKTQIENIKGVKFPDNVLEFVKNGRESYEKTS